jgi:hypothetical protein
MHLWAKLEAPAVGFTYKEMRNGVLFYICTVYVQYLFDLFLRKRAYASKGKSHKTFISGFFHKLNPIISLKVLSSEN